MTLPSEVIIGISKAIAAAEHRNEATHVAMLEILATMSGMIVDLSQSLEDATATINEMSEKLEAVETHARRTEIQTRR